MDLMKISTHSLILVNAQKMKMNCETVSLPKPPKYILTDAPSSRNPLN